MTPITPSLGRGAYATFCELLGVEPLTDPYSPARRASHLPRWAQMPLIATEAARTKLQGWATSTPRERWDDVPDLVDVLLELQFIGDRVLAQLTAEVLRELPRPVRDYAIAHTTFLGAGAEIGGFCAPPIDQAARPFTVVVSGSDHTRDGIRRIIAHETGHVWLLPEQADAVAMSAVVQSALLDALVVPDDVRDRCQAARRRDAVDERQVHALLRAWGYEAAA